MVRFVLNVVGVIHINMSHRDLRKNTCTTGDLGFVKSNWKPMSRRMAKKKNSYMFTVSKKKGMHFYSCTKKSLSGCTVHQERPQVCSGYPFYKVTPEQINGLGQRADYTPSYTEFYKIPITLID